MVSSHSANESLLVGVVEDGAAVGPAVVVQVEAGRVRLGQEQAAVAQRGQRALEELKVIHFLWKTITKIIRKLLNFMSNTACMYLQAYDVRRVPDDLLEHAVPPGPPVQSAGGAADEVVVLSSES